MTYEETLHYLYNQLPVFQQVGSSAYKPGLGNSEALDVFFDHPHRKYHTIHIAGTNGKGSTSHLLAAILQQSGYKVGLYTSPHLVDFRERIRVNGEVISKEAVMDFTQRYIEPTRNIHPSFFELTMMMAFDYFAACKVDVAVIEVGLGGRLDSTNIITPDLSIITNISFDHVQFLGNTLPEIAKEKAGIIKEGVPVVIGRARGAVKKVFSAKAEEMNAPITYTKQTAAGNDVAIYSYPELQKERNSFYEMTRQGLEMLKTLQDKHRKNEKSLEKLLSTFNLDNALRAMDRILDKRKSAIKLSNNHFQDGIFLELTGLYQIENGFTILTALDELVKMGYHISPKNYFEGFSNVCELTGLMGRWQKVYSYPDIICDTGHNVDGIKYICKQLEAIRANDGKKIHIVFGMVNDKDISGVLKILPKDATYYFTKASVKRALPENELQELAQKAGLKGNAYPTVVEAVQAAKKGCPPKDFIFVGGSSFIVADLLANRDTLDLY